MNAQSKNKSISTRLVIMTLLLSSAITSVFTIVRFYIEYSTEVGILQETLTQVERSYVKSLEEALWDLNNSLVNVQLNGILQVGDMVYAKVIGSKGNIVGEANRKTIEDTSVIIKKFPLIKKSEGKTWNLGTLSVEVSKRNMNHRLFINIMYFILSQGAKTFITSFAFFLLFQTFVVRHVSAIANYFLTLTIPSSKNNLQFQNALQLDKKKNGDEIDFLVDSINTMQNNLIEKDNQLQSLLKSLENKVEDGTSQLKKKNADMNAILTNIHQGILTFEKDLFISNEYSSYLEELFENKNLRDKKINVCEFLFNGAQLPLEAIEQFKNVIETIIGESVLSFNINKHHLIREFEKKMPNGKIKKLVLDWNPILDDNKIVEKIMVVIRDTTELKALQIEAKIHEEDLTMIGQILEAPANRFQSFLQSSLSVLKESESLIINHPDFDNRVLRTLFHNMHTIKGNCRTYGLSILDKPIYQAEEDYGELFEGKGTWDRKKLISNIRAVESKIKRYHDIFERKLKPISESIMLKSVENTKLLGVINTLVFSKLENEEIRKKLVNLINLNSTHSLNEIIRPVLDRLPDLAKELQKEIPEVQIIDNNIRFLDLAVPLLENCTIHLLRNSLDHGLETKEERIAKNKSPYGFIGISLTMDSEYVQCKFWDDGRGLDLKQIRKIAESRGLVKENHTISDQEIARYIFEIGFTTSKSKSLVSGRGVGLDAVRSFVENQGGKIEIILQTIKTETMTQGIPFHLVLYLPKKLAVLTEQ